MKKVSQRKAAREPNIWTDTLAPNKRQRHALYKWLLEAIDTMGKHSGLCSMLFYEARYYGGIGSLPELIKQRPTKTHGAFWWPPYEKRSRKRAVKKAIELSAPKPRKQKQPA